MIPIYMDTVLSEALQSLIANDGLIVLARGLGLHRLVIKCISYYLLDPSQLVFIVNASTDFHAVLTEGLYAEGFYPSQIPKVRRWHNR